MPTTGTFGIWWAAAIVEWRESLDEGSRRLNYAMNWMPRVEGVIEASFEVDATTVCFRVVVDRQTPTVAQAVAIRALRDGLSAAGVGVGPSATWSLLQLDPDPSPLDLKPVHVDRLALRQARN